MRCFYTHASQVEGWFKGELMYFLDQEKRLGGLFDMEREKLVKVGDKRISVDFLLHLKDVNSDNLCWVEIKHWHIGMQNGIDYGSGWYFKTESHSACVRCDIEKLSTIPGIAARTMLILNTKNPGVQDWNSGVETFNERFAPLHVRSLTTPDDYPDYFFLGLLHATTKRA
jgi:hypothetical protein